MLNFLNKTVSNQIYFVYGLIAVVLVLILMILLMDRKDRKRVSKNIKKLSIVRGENFKTLKAMETELKPIKNVTPEIELVEETIVPIEVAEVIPANEIPGQDIIHEEVTYVERDSELEKTQAQLELQHLTDELRNAKDSRISLTHFEVEQEENAIISINELMKKSNELYDKNEITQYMDEGNEPINIEELRKKFESDTLRIGSEQQLIVDEVIETPLKKEVILAEFSPVPTPETIKETSKFKSSPFISPIYGLEKGQEQKKQDQVVTTIFHEDSIELEQTADLDQLDEEIRKTNEFLQVLKELQKNLD